MQDAPTIRELVPPDRTLMGPGPSDIHPRVYRAMMAPVVGYLDNSYTNVMDDVQNGLRYLFQTSNTHTFAVSGTGSAAMETALVNLTEPGETVLIPTNGYFGQRLGEIVERIGGNVVTVSAPWGEPLSPSAVQRAFDQHQPSIFAFVHGETSTGVKQPNVAELVDIAHKHDAYVIVDTVASIGGVEFHADDWGVDVVYAGSQKCLSAPPGASPISFAERAVEKIRNRESAINSWYLDFDGVWEYWGDARNYHHTGPISTMYALRESLRLLTEEGIEDAWDRHTHVASALRAGIEAMGLSLHVDDECWLPTLNAVTVPDNVDDNAVINTLLNEYGIEIVGGLGDLAGEIFRVGCMGYSARPANVSQFVGAFGSALNAHGADIDVSAGAGKASEVLNKQ